jgi:hypothetical protein
VIAWKGDVSEDWQFGIQEWLFGWLDSAEPVRGQRGQRETREGTNYPIIKNATVVNKRQLTLYTRHLQALEMLRRENTAELSTRADGHSKILTLD